NGLQGFSRTNLVNYMTLSRIYSKKQQKTAELANTLSRQQQSARELKKEFEKLKIMKERGELQRQHLKEYKEKLKKFKKDVASGLEKTESFKEHKQKPELFFSAEVKEKLGLIQKELKKIDREFLQSLQTEMEDILKEVEFNKKDVTDFLQKFEMEDLHKSLDNVYQSVKQLQKLQQFDALEKMAAALYEKYEDVRATAISKNDHDFFNKEKRKIENDLQSLTEHYNKLRPDMNFSDKESKKLLADLDRDLDSSSLQDFKNFNLKNDNFQPAQRFADKFGKIKKNISLLTRRMKNMDIGKAVTEINKQLAGFTVHIKWNNDLSRGHVYDLEDIYNNTLNKLYADYLSGLNTVTLRSKEHLYDLLAGYIPGFLDFLKTYDRLVLNNRKLLQKLDPALNYKAVDAYRIRENAGLVVLRYNRLVYDLLNLKKMLLKQQQQNSMQNSFNKALSKQQSLNQRLRQMMQQGKLSSQMMEYIKQSAMQQAMIRSMLEQMQKGQGKPKPSGKPGGRQSRTPGADQTLKQIIEEMKKLEGDLKKFKKNDTQRIIKKQRKIEEKLLQYNKGLKEKRQKNKKKERKAESAARQFVGSEEQIKEKYKNLIKQLQELQKSENYPKEYEERIQRYLHKLNQLQKQ
ncbi:MAG TPA: hypothetical protein VKS21_13940, partial [Spirochaetota bacterium]|nr:hypothetical protein [Spirochaetota bacterium]